ncbi:hypothetical protein C5748_25145 [Phyllobacterium phragmitis]|uniref:HTH gntR-type domain-containing protein n=1 Tax=Phyllobacterium phragmitis TaxID=2670329 RepID=A0A2S9IJR1_9HYPH|nr:GntR family transcriptional regulator [Phyllobacterium phragmitis]PRD40771.1 hypothetical protein C5748_25145 [Phyllobacterium phragmitis]
MHKATQAETTLDAIRRTICINGYEGDTVLYETELATQFGMSRTPIRQILQRLAYERLVFTKSGVGTVVTPLVPEDKARDLTTLSGLVGAILLHDLPALSVSQHSDVVALHGFARALEPQDAETHYELLSRLHACLTGLIPDPILRDAFSAGLWRAIRWYMRDLSCAPERTATFLRDLTVDTAQYQERSASDLFQRLRQHIAP